MFSSRLNWNQETNRLVRILEEKRRAGEIILDLTESNPTRAGFKYPEQEILGALSQTESLRYEPSPRGLLKAREAVAAYYRMRGKETDTDSIFLTASTSEAYADLFKLLADPGDEILVPAPGYPLFEMLSALESVKPIFYPLKYDENHGWRIDLEMLQMSVSTKTRAVVVVNPNNPTGSYLKIGELEIINEICAEHQLALIVDEVFSDYRLSANEQIVLSAAGNQPVLTFVLNGFSKILGLPQLKLAWILVNEPQSLVSDAIHRLEFIADTFLSVSASVQHAAPELFRLRDSIQKQIQSRTNDNYKYLEITGKQSGTFRVLKREGGWYAVVQLRGAQSAETTSYRLLEEKNVYLHPGYFYNFKKDEFLVVSLLPPVESLREGTSRLAALLKNS